MTENLNMNKHELQFIHKLKLTHHTPHSSPKYQQCNSNSSSSSRTQNIYSVFSFLLLLFWLLLLFPFYFKLKKSFSVLPLKYKINSWCLRKCILDHWLCPKNRNREGGKEIGIGFLITHLHMYIHTYIHNRTHV